jgi:undecaprenyl diphosphate synthase
LYVSPKLWPDWTGEDLAAALADFQARNRRFGGVPAAAPPADAASAFGA